MTSAKVAKRLRWDAKHRASRHQKGAHTRTVTIWGTGPSLITGPGEHWGLNAPWRSGATRWFQLHPAAGRTEREDRVLAECPVPIYVLDAKQTKNPQARVYPLTSIAEGPLSSSFDYMLALALLEKFATVHLKDIRLQHGGPRERL